MKRKLIRRNKQFLSSTMGKYTGYRSWQRVTDCDPLKVGDYEAFLQWLDTPPRKIQWKYEWLISNKAIDAHLKDLEDNYEEISLDEH